jgi:hypothetical protein
VKNVVMNPVGLGTKNHCAGEDHQQFGNQSVSQPASQLVSQGEKTSQPISQPAN